jgi:hypothetical protein
VVVGITRGNSTQRSLDKVVINMAHSRDMTNKVVTTDLMLTMRTRKNTNQGTIPAEGIKGEDTKTTMVEDLPVSCATVWVI